MSNDTEPQPPTFVNLRESRYNGRSFYACQGMTSADQAAELHYLRDWKAWAERELAAVRAFGNRIVQNARPLDRTGEPHDR